MEKVCIPIEYLIHLFLSLFNHIIFTEGSKLSLPAARTTQRPSEDIEEDEIEDIAKPKEWEKVIF